MSQSVDHPVLYPFDLNMKLEVGAGCSFEERYCFPESFII